MGVRNSGAPEGLTVPAPNVTPVVLLLNDTHIIYDMEIVFEYGTKNVNTYDNMNNTNPTKTRTKLRCSGRVGSSCSICGIR